MSKYKFSKSQLALAISAAILQGSALAYESPIHVFSVDDVMGGFDGSTFGTSGATQDKDIICDLGPVPCPVENPAFLDKSGVKLYPVDSEFGYYVVDFLGAKGKSRDGDYMEGYVGNIIEGTEVVGIQVSNAATEKYKVKPPLGTWCQGLGGTSVKCETEHYVVMEHVQSCHEVIPYKFADPETGDQGTLPTPLLGDYPEFFFNCSEAALDDNVEILVNGIKGDRLVNSTPCEGEDEPEGCQMFPNDKTDMRNNIALSTDYSVQLKDDGKPLYGWGGIHKRPNDIRMYARLELPAEWKEEGANFAVTRAELVVNHWITNNPNDQLRPEDLENEAATGRKPDYQVVNEGTDDEVWTSLEPCYEGDGDFIEGDVPATPIGAGTVLKNTPFALDPAAEPGDLPADDPYAFSSDLKKGLTNAYYTTINRDPFEWSYLDKEDKANGLYDFIGTATPIEDPDAEGLELVSGPRWRLKPNKFGQDLPGLEIPLIECSAPPFQKENIKYVVGTPTTTIINLLDWDEDTNGPSPLATSQGWVDVAANKFVEVAQFVNGIPLTTNGLPMTDDFDLAVYVKGDRKSTAVYNAQLIIDYDDEAPQPPTDPVYDLALTGLIAPFKVTEGEEVVLTATVTNQGPDALFDDATVVLTGVTNRDTVVTTSEIFVNLAKGASTEIILTVTAPDDKSRKIDWTATVEADNDSNDANNIATDRSNITKD